MMNSLAKALKALSSVGMLGTALASTAILAQPHGASAQTCPTNVGCYPAAFSIATPHPTPDFAGISGYNSFTGNVDPFLVVAAGTPIPAGQHGVGVVQSIGPNGAFPVSNTSGSPFNTSIVGGVNSGGTGPNSASVDVNGNLAVQNGTSGSFSFSSTSATSMIIHNTSGYDVIAFDITASGGSPSNDLFAREDNGAGNFLLEPIACYSSAGGITYTGSIPVSATSISWRCSLAPSAEFRLDASAVSFMGATITISWSAGRAPSVIDPTGALPTARNSSLAVPITECDQEYTTGSSPITTAGTSQLVPLNATAKVYVCSIVLYNSGSTIATAQIGSSGGTCTSETPMSMPYPLSTSSPLFQRSAGTGYIYVTPSADKALCVTVAGTTPSVNIDMMYAQY